MEESKFVLSYRRCCFVAALHQQELFLNNKKTFSDLSSSKIFCQTSDQEETAAAPQEVWTDCPTPRAIQLLLAPRCFQRLDGKLSVSLPNCAGLHLLTDSFPGRRRSVGTSDLNRLELCCTWRAVTLTARWEILEVCDFPWTVQLSKRRSYRPRLNLS